MNTHYFNIHVKIFIYLLNDLPSADPIKMYEPYRESNALIIIVQYSIDSAQALKS